MQKLVLNYQSSQVYLIELLFYSILIDIYIKFSILFYNLDINIILENQIKHL
jgi:hypothetical protein